MGNVNSHTGISFEISRREVMEQLSCEAGNRCYDEFAEEYEELYPILRDACHPEILVCAGDLPEEPALLPAGGKEGGRQVLYVLYTIGKEASSLSSSFFMQGDCVKGMLADAMADSALFSIEKELHAIVKEYCSKNACGITGRLEAPQDIPMEMQRVIYEQTKGDQYGIKISSGYMFDPVKTSACVFLLTDDSSQFQIQHDCASCLNLSCKKRKVEILSIKVRRGEAEELIRMKAGENLMRIMAQQGIRLPADCGGTGRCGKCRILVEEGILTGTKEEKRYFTPKEWEDGWRLACCSFPQMNLAIRVDDWEEDFIVLTEHGLHQEKNLPEKGSKQHTQDQDWVIAADIGTTTLAMQIIGGQSGKVLKTWTGVNHQRRFGADVMARIGAACHGHLKDLQMCIQKDLRDGIRELTRDFKMSGQIRQMALAGNTTMLHLLLGYDCEGLSHVPFTPVSLKQEERRLRELLNIVLKEDAYLGGMFLDESFLEMPVVILPGISSFVGADILAGLYQCRFDTPDGVNFFIDLGTNGEMAVRNADCILCASTAAGPALEGGCISCGMGSLPGAVSHVSIRENQTVVETMKGKAPQGICGSGVLEMVSELYQAGMMDAMGRLKDPYFEQGYLLTEEGGKRICFTQKDVREVQLAKAAVRAGIEALLAKAGIRADDVDTVYLAGGLGVSLDLDKAFGIGLFPEGFKGKIIISGNTSLGGCVKYLRFPGEKERIENILLKSRVLDLSADPVFQEYYIESMLFGEE